MEIAGKTVAFLGDSITEGVGVSEISKRYTDVFGALTGAVVLNYGISGTRIAKQKNPSPTEQWDLDFISRVDAMDRFADAVVVFGGTNDFGHGDAPLGKFTDRTEYTFYGACHVLYRKLIEKYPDAEIVIVTPLHRLSESAEINEYGLPCAPLKKYVEAIREVAEYYSLPLLDLYKNSGMQPSVEILREKYMPDGLHPSDAGAEKIADKLRDFFLSL